VRGPAGIALRRLTLVTLAAAHLLIVPSAGRAQQTVKYLTRISGIEDKDLLGKIEDASRLKSMEKQPPPSLAALRRRSEKDLERFSKVLRSEGYYDSALEYRIDTSKEPLRVRVRIDPGPIYKLASFDVVLESDDLEPAKKAVDKARDQVELQKQARAGEIVKAEDFILRELARTGYPFPKMVEREAVVDHAVRTVTVRTKISTGRRARFGEPRVTGVRKALAEYASHRAPWEIGDRYDPDQLETYRTRLAATGLFSTIRIKPDENVRDDGLLPIIVELARGKLRSIGAGAYYSSSEGPGGTAYWEHRDIFGRAERLRISGEASSLGAAGKLSFRKPDFFSPVQALVFETAYELQETDAFDSRKFKTFLGLERTFARHWTVLGGGAFEIGPVEEPEDVENPQNPDDEEIVEDTDNVTLVGLPFDVKRDTANDLLDPTRGSRLEFYVAPYIEQLGSDLSFVVTRISNSLYLPLDERRRFVVAGRASIGSITGAGTDEVPADKRFYSGGGGSIRGFAFQQVGPLDANENPEGGSSLVEASLELRWRIKNVFGIVPFVDAGNVYPDNYPSFDAKSFSSDAVAGLFWGAGLGLRYYSPVGPIRLDVATPLNPRSGVDDPVQFYISLGQAF
jgi:translocation and assembly module TamA